MLIFFDGIKVTKKAGYFGEMGRANKLQHQIAGKHDHIIASMFGKCSVDWMRMIHVAVAAPVPANGRANSSAAIVIDVTSSGTVRSTIYSKQKLEAAAADRATYSSR